MTMIFKDFSYLETELSQFVENRVRLSQDAANNLTCMDTVNIKSNKFNRLTCCRCALKITCMPAKDNSGDRSISVSIS